MQFANSTRAIDGASNAAPISPLQRATNELSKQLDGLHADIQSLEGKLSTVLVPPPPANEKAPAPMPHPAQAVAQIENLTAVVEAARSQLQAIYERVSV